MKNFLQKYSHFLLLLYLPIYFVTFFVAEQIITDGYFISYLPLDDYIPFCPIFVLPYVLWYPYMLVPALFLLIKDIPAFKRFMYYFIISMSVSLIICLVFPNGQNLRITERVNENLFSKLVSIIYSADTNTNVLPSMHVVGSIGIMCAAFDSKIFRKLKIILVILGILICVSTVFIKQHSILDVLAGIILSGLTIVLVYIFPVKKVKSEE